MLLHGLRKEIKRMMERITEKLVKAQVKLSRRTTVIEDYTAMWGWIMACVGFLAGIGLALLVAESASWRLVVGTAGIFSIVIGVGSMLRLRALKKAYWEDVEAAENLKEHDAS